jgi:hypothetical protein
MDAAADSSWVCSRFMSLSLPPLFCLCPLWLLFCLHCLSVCFASTGFRFISILASIVEESISCLLLHRLLLHGWMLQQMMIHGSFGMFLEEFPEQFKHQHNVESLKQAAPEKKFVISPCLLIDSQLTGFLSFFLFLEYYFFSSSILSVLRRKFPKILNRPHWKLSEQTLTC